MDEEAVLLGVDIGTFSSKGVACLRDGSIIAEARVEHLPSVPRAGWMEHDAQAIWWAEFCFICQDLVRQIPARNIIAGVGLSTLAPCIVPVDKSGMPLRPAILYRADSRATHQIEQLYERHGEGPIEALGGGRLTSQSLGPKILWIRDMEPEVFAATDCFLTANGFIAGKLTGRHVIDRHHASYFSPFFDIRSGAWDLKFADRAVSEQQLPDLVWSSDVVGKILPEASDACGLPTGTSVVIGSADGLLEALAAGAAEAGSAMISYASTMNIVAFTDSMPPPSVFWLSMGLFPKTYVLSGGVATAGSITSWIRREMAREYPQVTSSDVMTTHRALLEEAAASPPGANGLLMLPHFSGEDTPVYDPNARGSVLGVGLISSRGDLYRAAMEGVGYALRSNIEGIEKVLGSAFHVVKAVGGGTQSQLWPQIVADISGIAQELPQRDTSASLGAAMLAGMSVGMVEQHGCERDWIGPLTAVEPNPHLRDLYNQGFKAFREAEATIRRMRTSNGSGAGA